MSDINHFICTGRVTTDAKMKQVGESVLFSFSVAVNRYSKKDKKDIPSFFFVDLWSSSERQSSFYADCLKKGMPVVVDGVLSQKKWQGQDGKEQSMVVIQANTISPMGGKKGGEPSGSFPSDDFPFE